MRCSEVKVESNVYGFAARATPLPYKETEGLQIVVQSEREVLTQGIAQPILASYALQNLHTPMQLSDCKK